MQKSGSVLLFTIIITSVLSFLTLSFWYKSGMLLDLVLLKEKFYKNFYLTEAILNYGFSVAKNNFEKQLQKPEIIDLSFLLDKRDKLQAILVVRKSAERALFLCATLQRDKKVLFKRNATRYVRAYRYMLQLFNLELKFTYLYDFLNLALRKLQLEARESIQDIDQFVDITDINLGYYQ